MLGTSAALEFGDYEEATIHLIGAQAVSDDAGGLPTPPEVLQYGIDPGLQAIYVLFCSQQSFLKTYWDPEDISWAFLFRFWKRSWRRSGADTRQTATAGGTPRENNGSN